MQTYTISTAAKKSGLTAKTIRDYEKLGLVAATARTPAGYRQYNDDDIATLQFIHRAREVIFSLAQIETLLKLRDNPNRRSAEVKALVGAHIAEIGRKIAVLNDVRATLQRWHDACAGDEHAHCAIIEKLEH